MAAKMQNARLMFVYLPRNLPMWGPPHLDFILLPHGTLNKQHASHAVVITCPSILPGAKEGPIAEGRHPEATSTPQSTWSTTNVI